jgi:hypothetical protein
MKLTDLTITPQFPSNKNQPEELRGLMILHRLVVNLARTHLYPCRLQLLTLALLQESLAALGALIVKAELVAVFQLQARFPGALAYGTTTRERSLLRD